MQLSFIIGIVGLGCHVCDLLSSQLFADAQLRVQASATNSLVEVGFIGCLNFKQWAALYNVRSTEAVRAEQSARCLWFTYRQDEVNLSVDKIIAKGEMVCKIRRKSDLL